MWTLNGVGTKMLGRFSDRELGRAYFSGLWFTFLFIPIIPLGVYLISHPLDAKGREQMGSFRFHGTDFRKLYPGARSSMAAFSFAQGAAFLLIVAAAFALMMALGFHGFVRVGL